MSLLVTLLCCTFELLFLITEVLFVFFFFTDVTVHLKEAVSFFPLLPRQYPSYFTRNVIFKGLLGPSLWCVSIWTFLRSPHSLWPRSRTYHLTSSAQLCWPSGWFLKTANRLRNVHLLFSGLMFSFLYASFSVSFIFSNKDGHKNPEPLVHEGCGLVVHQGPHDTSAKFSELM